MAAAAASLVTPLAVELVVRLVEKLFGPKTGAVKKPTATAVLQAIGAGMVSAGQAAASQLPDAAMAGQQVQDAVDRLNLKGQLVGAATVVGDAVSLSQADARQMLKVLVSIAPTLGAATS